MSVLNTQKFNREVVYTVGGTASAGPFDIPFPFQDEDEIQVLVNEEVISAYTVSQPDQFGIEGNSITLDAAVANATVTVISNTGESRNVSDTFVQGELSKEIDRIFAILQELAQRFGRTVRLGYGEEAGVYYPQDGRSPVWDEMNKSFTNGPTGDEIANANNYAIAAANSATNSANSASASASSATASANSATASANSASAALVSENEAADFADDAEASAIASANSATASANSATASADSATASAGSASNAATSEGNAASSATAASNSATASANSASDSADSATASANSATASANSATDSQNSADTAAFWADAVANDAAALNRETFVSSAAPTAGEGDDGDVWFQY